MVSFFSDGGWKIQWFKPCRKTFATSNITRISDSFKCPYLNTTNFETIFLMVGLSNGGSPPGNSIFGSRLLKIESFRSLKRVLYTDLVDSSFRTRILKKSESVSTIALKSWFRLLPLWSPRSETWLPGRKQFSVLFREILIEKIKLT